MGKDEVEIPSYSVETDMDRDLLIDKPYEDVYVNWLEYKIAYADGEISKMNNAAALYNTLLASYKRYYKRKHKCAHVPGFNYLH